MGTTVGRELVIGPEVREGTTVGRKLLVGPDVLAPEGESDGPVDCCVEGLVVAFVVIVGPPLGLVDRNSTVGTPVSVDDGEELPDASTVGASDEEGAALIVGNKVGAGDEEGSALIVGTNVGT